ncbi:hypothetical protein BH11ACT2_BH11ACT2_19400 [soil metagenome]
MGDQSVIDATGKTPDEWFALLDAAKASTMAHADIVAIVAHNGAPPWWTQNVTVRYEQARGMRLPGQRADGTFDVTKSRALALDQHAALDAVLAVLVPELGDPASENRTAKYFRARWKLADDTRLLASADPEQRGKTPIVLTHSKLPLGTDLDAVRERLGAWLAAIS